MDARAAAPRQSGEIQPTTGEETAATWRAEVLDVWLGVGALIFPVTALAVVALRHSPRLDASGIGLLVFAALNLALQRARRMRFELRAAAAIVLFTSPALFWMARSGFILGGAAMLVTSVLLTALLFGQRHAFALLLVIAGSMLGLGWVAVHHADAMRFDDSDPRLFLNWARMTLSVTVIIAALVVAVTRVVRRFEQKRREAASALARLRSSEQALRIAYDQLGRLHGTVVSAQEEERRRIARELHDQVGQMLTALKLKLRLRSKSNGDTAIESDSIAIVDWLLERTRKLSLDLRPPLLEDGGLLAALELYLRDQQAISGVELRLHSAGLEARLSPEIDVTCFRIVQEAITNTLRHAGASSADVSLARLEDRLEITVHDDGRGFAPDLAFGDSAARGRMGLIGIRERAHSSGGTFAIESAPGAGTTVHVSLPLPARVAPSALPSGALARVG